jgi:RNA polymerase sigma-70 factor (ECF subfamily)
VLSANQGEGDLSKLMPSPSTQPRRCLAAYQGEFEYVCRTLRRFGFRAADIEDMAQEIYLVLRRRWEEYDETRPLRPWLFSIIYGVATAYRRRNARELSYAGTDTELEVEDPAPHPERALQLRQTRALVLRALDRLPLTRRAVLVMHEIDQVPIREVASALQIPVFTAYSRLRKARIEFRTAADTLRRKGHSL